MPKRKQKKNQPQKEQAQMPAAAEQEAAQAQTLNGLDYASTNSDHISTMTDPATSMSVTTQVTEHAQLDPLEARIELEASSVQHEPIEETKSFEAIKVEDQAQNICHSEEEKICDNQATSQLLQDEISEPLDEFYDEEKAGTPYQNVILINYPMTTRDQKLKVPYIERFNGNLCVQKGDHESAIKHYNKSLLSLQMMFKMTENPIVQTPQEGVKLIKEVEILVCVNLSLCYIKIKQYHYAIKYASQAIENDPENVKALFRRGSAYTKIGELVKSKEDFDEAMQLTTDEGMKNSIKLAMQEIKNVEVRNQIREKKTFQRMFNSQEGKSTAPKGDAVSQGDQAVQEEDGTTEQTQAVAVRQQKTTLEQIFALVYWLVLLPYSLPLSVTKFALSLVWTIICVVSLITAAVTVYIPVVGERLAQLFLIPSKIDRIPQQPIVKLFLEIVQARRGMAPKGKYTEMDMSNKKGEN